MDLLTFPGWPFAAFAGYLIGLATGVYYVGRPLRTRPFPRSSPRIYRSQLPTLPSINLDELAQACREDTRRG